MLEVAALRRELFPHRALRGDVELQRDEARDLPASIESRLDGEVDPVRLAGLRVVAHLAHERLACAHLLLHERHRRRIGLGPLEALEELAGAATDAVLERESRESAEAGVPPGDRSPGVGEQHGPARELYGLGEAVKVLVSFLLEVNRLEHTEVLGDLVVRIAEHRSLGLHPVHVPIALHQPELELPRLAGRHGALQDQAILVVVAGDRQRDRGLDLARFIADLVDEHLDLSGFYAGYKGCRGGRRLIRG